MTEWVFFDVDQTLCDFDTMMRRALGRSIAEIERRWPPTAGRFRPEDLEAVRNRLAATYTDGPVPLIAVRRQMFATALGDIATERQVEEITDDYLQHRFADPILFDDVLPALNRLTAAGVNLGVVTNGNSKLDSLGLADFFATEVVAEQVGYAKPDPRIYHYAAEAVGADPGRLLMVGDSLTNDVQAARAAGWRAVWLDRARGGDSGSATDGGGETGDTVDEAERISTLSELLSRTAP